jgi:Cu(I)/Ag(I) efflux system membrane fusion protein
MKMKMILIAVMAAALGGTAGWFAPHQLMSAGAATAGRKILYYTCPMHPSVKSDKPGDCPICGMKLQPAYADATGTNAVPPAPSGCCSF